MNTQNQDSIIDRVGAKDWKMVVEEFAGKTLQQIKEVLSNLWPHEETDDLAESIYDEVN